MPAILSYKDESYVITGIKLEESHYKISHLVCQQQCSNDRQLVNE